MNNQQCSKIISSLHTKETNLTIANIQDLFKRCFVDSRVEIVKVCKTTTTSTTSNNKHNIDNNNNNTTI